MILLVVKCLQKNSLGGHNKTAAYTGFCGSGAGRKASVIFSNSVQHLSQPTFIY